MAFFVFSPTAGRCCCCCRFPSSSSNDDMADESVEEDTDAAEVPESDEK